MNNHRIFFDKETKSDFSKIINKNYYHEADLEECSITENGFILPTVKKFDKKNYVYFEGGVVDKNKKFIKNSQFLRYENNGSLKKAYDFFQDKADFIDRDVMYAGMLINHFGHFLTESLSRIWYWCENSDKDMDIAFLMPKKQAVFPQFWEFMDLLGIDRNKIHIIRKVTKFNKIYVPQQAHILNKSFNKKFLVPYKYISSKLSESAKEKYYISRRKFKGGTLCMGEELLENLYKNNGFKIVYPEKLSLKEQVMIMKSASELAGVSGTGMHMALFADEGINITILERSDSPIKEQVIINQALKANAYYVGVNVNPLPTNHSIGPTILTISDSMVEYCNKKNFRIDQRFINYVKPKYGKKFIKLWLKYYSQPDNNKYFEKDAPLIAKRLMFISNAFIPIKKLIKQKIKSLTSRRTKL